MISDQDLSLVVSYVKREGIKINFEEFIFQTKNHPDYPTIVSITDTLNFFNIDNGVLRVEISEIALLPDRFVALLGEENSQSQFYYIEKKEDVYFYNSDDKQISISIATLESSWKNMVLLVEKSENETTQLSPKNLFTFVLPFLCVVLFAIVLFQFSQSIWTSFFFIFPILGILFSVAALKDLFGAKSELFNSFCNITGTSSCATVVDSNKWKIFEIVNFSDLSIVFFFSQFLGLLAFLLLGNATAYFGIQKIMLIYAVPVLFASIYYQKFVEEKWCPICLVIIGIILLELGYLLFLQQTTFEFLLQSIVVFGFVFVTAALVWFVLKKLLIQQKELKEFQIKGNRFMRNYEVFKNTLLASNPVKNNTIQSETILLGNVRAALKIIVVTSPFCGFCKEAYAIIEQILQKHSETVCFDIRFNFNDATSDKKSKKIHQQLIAIYLKQGQLAFMKTLHEWFETKDTIKLNSLVNTEINELKMNLILEKQFNWNQANELSYTPVIIIDKYVFPKQYDRKELIYFINDLSDDEDFQ